jgi:hypothetical protein
MNFKIVKLLLLSALFFAILLATSMLMTNVHANTTVDNLTHKPATTILMGDPVGGGGIPQVQPKGSRRI